jgi:glycosyltransferase involved in cell wall biosynthesis
MFASVVVITKNNSKTIGETITSLLNQTYPSDMYEIVVVDGHSNDGTDEIVTQFTKGNSNVRLLYENRGTMGYARNIGVEQSRGDVILFIDGDAQAPKDWIEKMVGALEGNLTVVGGLDILVSSSESTQIMDSWRRLKKIYGVKAIPCIKTVNFAVKRNALLSCGGFDPSLSHWDEAEVMARIYSKMKDARILYDPSIVVYHRHSRTSSLVRRIKGVFRRSVNGTAVLMRRHMIRVAIASPTSTIGVSFLLIPLCISGIIAVVLSIVTGLLLRNLIISLIVYLVALGTYVFFMFRRTRSSSLRVPLILTIDLVVRLTGTLVGLVKWLFSFSKSSTTADKK